MTPPDPSTAQETRVDKKKTGLYGKFNVSRVDGTDAPGKKHDGCEYFVLDMTHDYHAREALRAYANSCEKDFPVLARDLREKARLVGYGNLEGFGESYER